MNTSTPTTITINITGTITIDTNTLQQLIAGTPIQAPTPQSPRPSFTPKLVYNAKEAAELLGVERKTIYRLIDRRLLRCVGAIRHKRITHAEIERFLKATTGY